MQIDDLTSLEFIGILTGILGILMISLMAFLGIVLSIRDTYESED